MVTWHAPGLMSGFTITGNTTNVIEDALPGLTINALRLSTNGSVDAEGITRMQYSVDANPVTGNFRNAIQAIARVRFTTAEANAAASAGRRLGATLFVVAASEFAAGKVPTPEEILALGDAKMLSVNRFDNFTTTLAPNVDHSLAIEGTYRPPPNTKVWALVCPTSSVPGSTPSVANDIRMGFSPNGNSRAISLWGNRTPEAPVITSPGSESVYGAGASFDLTYTGKDPDKFSGGRGKGYTDEAGVQVQYRPKPTTAVPNPVWADLPIATKNETPSLGNGWYIDASVNNFPASDLTNGALYFWINKTMKVRCGGPVDVRDPGAGVLPAGAWQIRMRAFDYGHPYPRWKKPLGQADGNTTPSTYPALNTSPWSNVVSVTVSDQVLPPVPISPISAVAIPEGTPITLRWRYRNTYVPPFAQRQRTVQMRKVGDPDWQTIVSGNGSDPEYPLNSPAPVVPGPVVEYLTDRSFESGTLGGWQTTSTNGIVNQDNSVFPFARTGTKYLFMPPVGMVGPLIYQFVTLNPTHTFFTFEGWVTGESGTAVLSVFFVDDANTQISSHVYAGEQGASYKRLFLRDLPRPAGATKVLIQIASIADGGATSLTMDDVSFVGADHRPSDPTPVYNPLVLETGNEYEWRVQVTDDSLTVSGWSQIARFWYVPAGASGEVRPVPANTIDGAELGCGTHRVEVYRRGGKERVGELTELSYVDWGRLRDDISDAKVIVSGWSLDCGNLLADLQTWAYELVIWRDNGYSVDRVWEGPITKLSYEDERVVIDAKDVIAYLYRRIVRQGIDDTGKSPTAGRTVVARALQVIQNGFAPDDPNVLAYLQAIVGENDAKQYRKLPPYSRTVYEEVDDMAANAGLDYTAVGRAILLWGTKHRIGTLPEFRDENLGSKPIVSEYGMSAANVYSVSDGQGTHGEADRLNDMGVDPIYGLIEVLSSSWASDSESEAGTYTQAGVETIKESFAESAEKSIASKYPPPVVVRIPDNTTLHPNTVISIQQLVPGVVIPLRSTATLRKVAANQKLDSIKVVETGMKDGGSETITITMSPFSREDSAPVEGEGE